ncbi:MAG: sigma-70 family RNA polymerase sigma factor [Candidatus Omnitrophota bacterium]
MYPPDEELIARAKKKDKQAFTQLIDRYSSKILGYLNRYVGDYQKAEDLTSETFLNVYDRMDTYTEIGKFSSWLYMIATNCAKKELERKKRRQEVSLERPLEKEEKISLRELISDERERPDYSAREKELKELVYKAMDKLDKKYKDALLLCDIEGLPYDEVAKILKTNPITVGTRVRRARVMLYNILRKYGYDF